MTEPYDFVRLHGPVELVSSETNCWKCHKQTPVHALCAADVEEFGQGGEPLRTKSPTLVYDLSVDALPTPVEVTMDKVAPNFKPLFSRTTGATNWSNSCVHCGLLQGAFFLHNEPDGPFFGGAKVFDGAKVVVSEQGFDVSGASYSL